jgi:hypothetical protein
VINQCATDGVFYQYKKDGREMLGTSLLKNPERLKKVALERSKMFLRTKLSEYGPEGCTKDEIKKLTSWGFYNPNT